MTVDNPVSTDIEADLDVSLEPEPEREDRRTASEELAPRPPSGPLQGLDLLRAIGLLFSALGFLIGSRVIFDNSFLTHLATGRIILDTGSVPSVDPYSASAPGGPWTVQSWLPSLVYASLIEFVGDWGVRLLHGLITALSIGKIWRLLSSVQSVVVRVALAAIPMTIAAETWGPRPLLVGVLGMILILEFLHNDRNPAWLIPIAWVWVNSHGSFPLAGVLVVAHGAGQWLDTKERPERSLKVLAWLSGGILLGMVGPLGWRSLWFPVKLLMNSEALEGVAEWSSPNYKNVSQMLFAAVILLAISLGSRKTSWTFIVPSSVFLVSGLLAVRSISVASIVVVVLAAPYVAEYQGGIDGHRSSLVTRAMAVVSICLIVVASVVVMSEGSLDLSNYPVDEVDWLEERGLVATEGVTLIHKDTVGNYLDLRFGSEARVFFDDRFDYYPAELNTDHLDLHRGVRLREILERWEADVILWKTTTPLESMILETSDWTIVQAGEDWFIACNTVSPVYEACLAP